jgi:hypothetical protein
MSRCNHQLSPEEAKVLAHNVSQHEDRTIAGFFELLEQQQGLLIVAQAPFCESAC